MVSIFTPAAPLSVEAQLSVIANGCCILGDCFWEPRVPGAAAWALLRRGAEQFGGLGPTLVREASQEAKKLSVEQMPLLYGRLFIDPFDTLAAPYSSVYLDQDDGETGGTQAEVLGYYRNAEIGIPPRAGETPDHISVELEFLYLLLVRVIQDEDVVRLALAAQFASEHLSLWLPAFAAQLDVFPEAKFYSCLSKLAVLLAEKCGQLG